jgi:DNA-directed RNA polymerase specialized sigma24 family protein
MQTQTLPTPVNDSSIHQDELQALIATASCYPPGHPMRQKIITQLIRIIQPRLWKENTPDYADALQQTWLYLCRHLDRYNGDRGSVVTWLNAHLKWRLFDLRQRSARYDAIHQPLQGDQASGLLAIDPPAPMRSSGAPLPLTVDLVREWVETDPTGELGRIHLNNHPQVTCQVLLLRRLPPPTKWRVLSQEWQVPLPKLSAFYYRECLPRLRDFGESEGYL